MLKNNKKYIQIAFNKTMYEVEKMVALLPSSDHIIIEAGTSFIKNYGESGVHRLNDLWRAKVGEEGIVVADLKCMDRGFTEVNAAALAGAKGATCLGLAPIETIDEFILSCKKLNIFSMVDMLNVTFPFEILQKLKKIPDAVVLHRGVDEAKNKLKTVPYHEINRIKGAYNIKIAVAGGETPKEASRSFFNGADITIVWKEFFNDKDNTAELADLFLHTIKGYGK